MAAEKLQEAPDTHYYGEGPPDAAAVPAGRSTGILEKAPGPVFPPVPVTPPSVPVRG
jgi:hypothetical protein